MEVQHCFCINAISSLETSLKDRRELIGTLLVRETDMKTHKLTDRVNQSHFGYDVGPAATFSLTGASFDI